MIIYTTFTEPVFNVVIHCKNAMTDAIFTIIDASGNVIAKIQMTKALGMTFGGYDYDARDKRTYSESIGYSWQGFGEKVF